MSDPVDIRDFTRQIIEETRNGSTSNRALLRVTIGATAVFTLLATVIAVVALFYGITTSQQNYDLRRDIAELKQQCEQAKRDYVAARQTISRERKRSQ